MPSGSNRDDVLRGHVQRIRSARCRRSRSPRLRRRKERRRVDGGAGSDDRAAGHDDCAATGESGSHLSADAGGAVARRNAAALDAALREEWAASTMGAACRGTPS